MTKAQFQTAAKRIYWMVSIWSVVFAATTPWIIQMLGTTIGNYGHFVRGHLGELVGGAVGGLTLGVPAMLAWLAVVLALDRRFGLRCPHCHRSLTLRCRHEQVVQTGQCSLCHGVVINET